MKKTYFLDKIHNANIREFERILNSIIEDLNQKDFPYSYFKKDKNWLIEIEKDGGLISVIFDDYTMSIYSQDKCKGAEYSNRWRSLFYKFLHKNQKYYYNKGLQKIESQNEDNKNSLDQKEIEESIKL